MLEGHFSPLHLVILLFGAAMLLVIPFLIVLLVLGIYQPKASNRN
jgi:hypothetical protein